MARLNAAARHADFSSDRTNAVARVLLRVLLLNVAVAVADGIVLSGSLDNTLRRWDLKTGQSIGEPLRGHRGCVRAVAVRDGIVVSGSDDKTVRRWDLKTGEPFGEPLRGHEQAVGTVAVAEGIVVSGSYDNTVRCWALQTGRLLSVIRLGSTVLGVALAGSAIIAACNSGLVRIDICR